LKKANSIHADADRCMKMLAAELKLLIDKNRPDSWNVSPIPDYMGGYLTAMVVSEYMTERIYNPSDAVKEFLKKNKHIEGVLFTKEDLIELNRIVASLEASKDLLNKLYGFSTVLN
jgi:hypothetical protein